MTGTWDFTRFATVLRSETALIKEISAIQDKVRQAVINREWTDFDEKLKEINRLGEEFTLLEDERSKLFSVLERPFYTFLMSLAVKERQELSFLYRELKMETFKMRALNETFLAYLDEAKTVAAAYIEAVCPARGGKLYTRKGKRVSQDLRSIVYNDRF